MEKTYDLEKRTEEFAIAVALFCKTLSKDAITIEFISQLVRSAGTGGANYIEANDSLGKKRFFHENPYLHERSQGKRVLAQNNKIYSAWLD